MRIYKLENNDIASYSLASQDEIIVLYEALSEWAYSLSIR